MESKIRKTLNPLAATILASAVPAMAAAGTLEEVVVTAQKRVQALEDVPISIAALSAESITEANVSTADGLAQLVPALRIDLAGAFSQPTIRGVGSSIAQVGASSNIATYVDGFYNPSQLTTNVQLANLESVQVLKGPQGTLFGRNATGGAILIKTKDPSTETSGVIKASIAEYNTQRHSAYFTTGLTDNLAVDISGYYDDGDGFLDNLDNGSDVVGSHERWGVRPSVLWHLNDSDSLKLTYEYSDWDDKTPLAANTYQGLGQSIPVAYGMAYSTDRHDKVALDQPAGYWAETDGWYLTGRFDLGWADLVSYTMFREEKTTTKMDLDGSAAIPPNPPWWAVRFDTQARTFTQEFDLSGNYGEKLDWVAGVFFYNFDDKFNTLTSQIPAFGFIQPTDVYDQIKNDIQSWAVFADATYHINEKWSFILGARYSYEDAEGALKIKPGDLLTLFPPPPIAPGDYHQNENWDNLSPRAVLQYQINDVSNVYLSYTQGFKAGLIPVSDTKVPLGKINPEEIDAYELGYKYLGEKTRFNAAAYYYDYNNLQVASYIGTASITTNAASSEIYGAEIQLDVLLSDHWSLNTGIAYTHGEYDKYLTAPYWQQVLAAAQFIATPGDASDNEMQRTPEWTATAGLQYETQLAGGTLRAIGNYYYTADFYLDPANQFKQDSYDLVSATLSWTTPGESYTFAVFGTNLTDEDYLTQVLPGPPAILQTWGEPRSFGASVTYLF